MLRIGILGTPVSATNRGVLALGASLVNLCASSAQAQVVLFLGHSDSQPAPFRIGGQVRSVPVVNCRLSPRSRPCHHLAWIVLACLLYRYLPFAFLRRILSRITPWITALESVDFAGDVRGGDSFSDIYGMKGFFHGFLMAWTVLLVKGTMVQFPQTYGPYKSPLARRMARFLLRRSQVVIARDEESRRLAQELLGPRREVWLSPDVAFSLEAVQPERLQLDPPLPQSVVGSPSSVVGSQSSVVGSQSSVVSGPSSVVSSPSSVVSPPSSVVPRPIGLNISGLMFNGGYTRDNMFGLKLDYPAFLPTLVEALLREHDGELWLVPHTYGIPDSVEDDLAACHRVRAALTPELQKRIRVVTGDYDCHQLKYIIGQCDFFIGSRMHACIAALSQGVPCVGVAYSKKFAGVFKTVGMEDWVIDGRTATNAEAVQRILALYQHRDGVPYELKRRADLAPQRLNEVFHDLFTLYVKNSPAIAAPQNQQAATVT